MKTETDLYRVIAAELSSKKIDTALWAQALSAAGGDADQCKALYIRLRHDALVAHCPATENASPTATAPVSAPAAGASAPIDNALRMVRWRLRRELAAQGTSTLYAVIGLAPDSSDDEVRSRVAELRGALPEGSCPTAELQYAMDTLGDPYSREHYDHSLLRKVCGEGDDTGSSTSSQAPGRGLGLGSLSGLWESRRGAVLAALALVIAASLAGASMVNSRREAEARQEQVRKEQELREKELALKQMATERVLDITDRNGDRILTAIEQEQQRRVDQQNYARAQVESARYAAEERRRQYEDESRRKMEERQRQEEDRRAQYEAQMEARQREANQRRLEAQMRADERRGPTAIVIGR